MPDEFTLTPQPVRLTGPSRQPLEQAMDVSRYASISALLGALAFQGTGPPVATFRIITGMQKDSDEGWVELLTFSATSTTGDFELLSADNTMLKYIRWELLSLSGSSPSVLFTMGGMLRTTA